MPDNTFTRHLSRHYLPCQKYQQRISAKISHYRNLFVAAMSSVIFVAHAEPSSKTEELCRQIIFWQKPIYTFDSDYNKNITDMGARPVNMDNVSGWANLFAAHNE